MTFTFIWLFVPEIKCSLIEGQKSTVQQQILCSLFSSSDTSAGVNWAAVDQSSFSSVKEQHTHFSEPPFRSLILKGQTFCFTFIKKKKLKKKNMFQKPLEELINYSFSTAGLEQETLFVSSASSAHTWTFHLPLNGKERMKTFGGAESELVKNYSVYPLGSRPLIKFFSNWYTKRSSRVSVCSGIILFKHF